jgi:hypothetical protein
MFGWLYDVPASVLLLIIVGGFAVVGASLRHVFWRLG